MRIMKKAIVFGHGWAWNQYCKEICSKYDVIAIADNNPREGDIRPEEIPTRPYDIIVLCLRDFLPVVRQLISIQEDCRDQLDFSVPCDLWGFDDIYMKNDEIIVTAGGISGFMESANDVSTFNTVMVEKEYDMTLPGKTIVIDVGMNIGFASLFFSCKENVEKIYAYEPFRNTYQKAIRNFALNSIEVGGRIVALNYALGKENGERIVGTISLDSKGSNTLLPHEAFQLPRFEQGERLSHNVKIGVLDAGEEVSRIKAVHPDCNLLLKMDVEGSEYEIIESLTNGSAIRNIDAIVMEFHTIKGKSIQADIVEVLLNNNYAIYDGSKFGEYRIYGTGYLIAVRR